MSKYSTWYQNYLQSASWHVKRNQVLIRDNFLCQACRSKPATLVHHKTYKHVGNEPLFDLESVCPSCHAFLTKMAHARVKSETLEQLLEQIFLKD